MANERLTEDIVRTHFREDPLFKSIRLEEQRSFSRGARPRCGGAPDWDYMERFVKGLSYSANL